MQNEKTPPAKVARDIQERTFNFSVRVIKLVGRLPRTIAANALAQPLIRSGTSYWRKTLKPKHSFKKPMSYHSLSVRLSAMP